MSNNSSSISTATNFSLVEFEDRMFEMDEVLLSSLNVDYFRPLRGDPACRGDGRSAWEPVHLRGLLSFQLQQPQLPLHRCSAHL